MTRLAGLLCGILLATIATAGTIYTPAGGSGSTPPYDWANPTYAAGADQLVTVSGWSDAGGAFGGATTVCQAAAPDARSLVIDAGHASDCSTATTGNRAQGALLSVAAGNFVQLFRVELRPNVSPWAVTAAISGGVVFVDGTTSAAAWYGLHTYQSADPNVPLYEYHHAAGAGAWDATPSYTLFGTVRMGEVVDWALVRSGTTLSAYVGPAGGPLVYVYAWTVTAGAGKVGVSLRTFSGSDSYYTATVRAYRASATGLP